MTISITKLSYSSLMGKGFSIAAALMGIQYQIQIIESGGLLEKYCKLLDKFNPSKK